MEVVDDEGTDSSASDSGAHDPAPERGAAAAAGGKRRPSPAQGRRVRRPTYLVRKEEKESLEDEIHMLEQRVELLKMRAGLPTSEAERALVTLQHANTEIEETIHSNLLGLARFQSLVAQHLHAVPVDPMTTFIHLPRDRDERRATLRAMRPMKLRRAKELVVDRLHGLSERQPYMTEERFVARSGNYHCRRFDIHQFHGLHGGARQLYEALIHYLSNMEISIMDILGQLTIREDIDCVDPTLWNHRVVSTTGAGYVQDLNSVGFAEFVEPGDRAEETASLGPYGIIAVDSVDADDLYPYIEDERVRKDVTAALMVSQVPGATLSDPPVAVLKRCVFVTIHKPRFALPSAVMDEVVANVTSWSSVMARFLRDHSVSSIDRTPGRPPHP